MSGGLRSWASGRGLGANLTLLSVAVILSLLGAEASSRWLTEPVRGVSWYHYDERYGHRHRANADMEVTIWGDGEPWRFRTNSRGFRGEEWPDAAPESLQRALVIGDSFTFGNAVEHEESYPRVADAALRRSAGAWELRNLGVSAWGTSNIVAYLESEGRAIRGDCLLYGFFVGNDVMDNVAHGLYELGDDGRLQRRRSARQHGWTATARKAARALPLYDFLLQHSQLFNLGRSAAMGLILKRDPVRQRQAGLRRIDPADFEEPLSLTGALMSRLAELSRRRFGGFGIVLIPTRGLLDESLAELDPYPSWPARASRSYVLEWAERQEVPVLDLKEHLPRDTALLRTLFFEKDFHCSVEGNRRIGELVARHLPTLCQALPSP